MFSSSLLFCFSGYTESTLTALENLSQVNGKDPFSPPKPQKPEEPATFAQKWKTKTILCQPEAFQVADDRLLCARRLLTPTYFYI